MSSALAGLILVFTAGATADERIVCVPKSDNSGWECGRGADAPAPRALPRSRSNAATAPPPFLIDPARLPQLMIDPMDDYAASPPPAEEAAAPQGASESVPRAAVSAAATTPAATPASEPPAAVIVSPPPVTAPPEPAAAAPVQPAPAAVASQTAAPEALKASVNPVPGTRTTADLLALPGSGFTVQLAAARTASGFDALRQRLGILANDTFVVRVRRGSEDWSLLLWRDFTDLAGARSAASTLNGSFWPRRLAPLQAEVRMMAD